MLLEQRDNDKLTQNDCKKEYEQHCPPRVYNQGSENSGTDVSYSEVGETGQNHFMTQKNNRLGKKPFINMNTEPDCSITCNSSKYSNI